MIATSSVGSGRYVLEQTLGEGAMGVVYRAYDRELGRHCALKALERSHHSAVAILRFRREFRAAARIVHPHCVQMYELDQDDAGWYFTMELATRGTLRRQTNRLSRRAITRLGLQMLAALDRIHASHIVHRDIKPDNILLFDAPDGTAALWAKLADFGVAQIADHDAQPIAGHFVGTPRYLAPEQHDGESIDPRADLYALGVVLYELLAGHHPHEPQPFRLEAGALAERVRTRDPHALRASAPDVPEELASFVHTLIARRRDLRYRTAAQAFSALRRCVENECADLDLVEREVAHLPVLEGSPYLAAPELIGREGELERVRCFLDATFEAPENDASAGRRVPSSTLLVGGPAGVGKSRLLSRVLALVRPKQPLVLIGACRQASATAYEPLAELFAALARPERGSDSTDRDAPHALTRTAGRTAPAAIEQHHEAAQTRFVMECTDRLLDVVGRRACLIVVEDVQWADSSTLELLLHWIRTLAALRAHGTRVRAALVLTQRSGAGEAPSEGLLELRKLVAEGVVEALEVALLAPDDAQALVASILMESDRSAVAGFTQRLFGAAPRTPLHIVQVLHLCLGHGWLAGGARPWGGTWRLDALAEADVLRLPQTIVEAIGERALHLSVRSQEVLAAASVLGRRFEIDVLERVLGKPAIDVLDALEEVEYAGFIVEEAGPLGSTHAFTHDRFVDAISARLPAARSVALHRAVARSLLELRGEGAAITARLAWHYHHAEDHAMACYYGLQAADEALAAFAFRRAAELYDAASASAARSGTHVPDLVRERHADAATGAGSYETAGRLYREVAASTSSAEKRLDLLRRAAELGYRHSKLHGATAPLEQVLEELGLHLPRTSSRLAFAIFSEGTRLALSAIRSPNFEGEQRMPAGAAEAAPALAQQRAKILTRTCIFLGEVYYFTDFRYTLYCALRAATSAVSARSAEDVAMTFSLASFVFSVAGLRVLARRLAETAERNARSSRAPADRAHVLTMTGNAYLAQGNVPAAVERFAHAYRLCESEGDPLRLANAGGSWSVALWLQGRSQEATRVAEQLIELGRRHQLERLYNFGRFAHTFGGLLNQDYALVASASAGLARDFRRTGDQMSRLVCEARCSLAVAFLGAPHEALPRILDIAEEWLLRGLYVPSDAVLGYCLATAALCASGGHRLEGSTRARLDRVRRVGGWRSAAHLPERTLLVAAEGLLDMSEGRRGSGHAHYRRGVALARHHGFLVQASIAEHLAARVLGK